MPPPLFFTSRPTIIPIKPCLPDMPELPCLSHSVLVSVLRLTGIYNTIHSLKCQTTCNALRGTMANNIFLPLQKEKEKEKKTEFQCMGGA